MFIMNIKNKVSLIATMWHMAYGELGSATKQEEEQHCEPHLSNVIPVTSYLESLMHDIGDSNPTDKEKRASWLNLIYYRCLLNQVQLLSGLSIAQLYSKKSSFSHSSVGYNVRKYLVWYPEKQTEKMLKQTEVIDSKNNKTGMKYEVDFQIYNGFWESGRW